MRSPSIRAWLVRSVSTRESRSHWFGSQTTNISATRAAKSCQRRRQGWSGSSRRQPSRASGGEDRQDRRGQHRVAGQDREAAAGEDREGEQGQRGGGDAEGGAAAQEGEPEHDAAEGADHPRPLQDLAEAPRPVEDEVDRPGLAFQRLDRFFGPGPGVERVAGGDRVEQAPRGPGRRARARSGHRGSRGSPSPGQVPV